MLTPECSSNKENAMLTIDENLCKKDGLCVTECPVSVITMKDKDSIPQAVEGAEITCLKCGHCVAVCPHAALSHKAVPLIQRMFDLLI